MGHYNKTILESVSCTSDHEVSIESVEDYTNFTIQIKVTGLTGGTASTILDILTAEAAADIAEYNTITGTAITFGATFTGSGVIRVVDLTTKNCKIKYSAGGATGGTIDYVTVTFS
tara:strand:- start:1609 stop:1956 length:348 start_codon:yes stop_codon:yes gene_type:complete